MPAYYAYIGSDDLGYKFISQNYGVSFQKPRHEIIGAPIREIIGEANFAFALPEVDCDREKIFQVLVNLVTKARDAIVESVAIPEGGVITIRTNYDEKTDCLICTVTDNGPGFPPRFAPASLTLSSPPR